LRYGEDEIRTVYTSDLARAVITAEIAFAGRGIPILQDARLRECDYGSWSGRPAQQLREAQLQFINEPFPGGESLRDVVRRMDSFLRELSPDTGPVLLVSHRVPWYALEHLIRGRDLVEVAQSPWEWQPGWEYTL
jgi:broad specificity phosphatase PhoE